MKSMVKTLAFFAALIFAFGSGQLAQAQWGQAVLEPVLVGPENDHLGHSALALDSQGTLHLVYDRWMGGSNHDFYYKKRPMGGTWSAPVLLGDSTANLLNPYLAVHKPSGFAYIVYLQNGALKLAIRNGFFWTYADLPTPGMDALFDPAVTVGTNGYAHVAVIVQTGGIFKIGYGYWDGFTFHFQVIQNSELGPYGSGAAPDICTTFDGGVAISYRGGTYLAYHIDVAENATLGGTTWDIQTIYQPDYQCYESSIKAAPNSDLHLAYSGDMGWGFPGRVFYAYKPDGALQWGPSTQISGTFSGVAPRLAVTDYNITPHVLFEERSGNILTGNICYTTNQSGSWVAQYLQQGDKYAPSLVMDEAQTTNGSMCFMQYVGSNNYDIYYYGFVGIGAGTGFPITLTPSNPPIQIPAGGGTFSFTCEVGNLSYLAVVIDAWTAVLLPDGTLYGPILNLQNFGIPPFSSRIRTFNQIVPPRAPSGTYIYLGYSGEYPLGVAAMDTFSFTKLGNDGSLATGGWPLDAGDWTATVSPLADEEPFILHPSAFGLLSVSPNPFNPETTLRYALTEAVHVELGIFDVLGRQVATLVDRTEEPGNRSVTWSGAHLPAGIYFARLTVGDQPPHMVKLALIK